jgi:hypothetical protein
VRDEIREFNQEEDMKRTVVFATLVVVLMTVAGTKPGSALGGQQPPTKKRERHPEIRKALAACQLAASDLEDASHDFCGHRETALDATDAAINQLNLALACDSTVTNPTMITVPHAASMTGEVAPEATKRERHPDIRKAIAALEVAAAALEDASHDFCGHREDALTAVNFAIDQLQAAIACDHK